METKPETKPMIVDKFNTLIFSDECQWDPRFLVSGYLFALGVMFVYS